MMSLEEQNKRDINLLMILIEHMQDEMSKLQVMYFINIGFTFVLLFVIVLLLIGVI